EARPRAGAGADPRAAPGQRCRHTSARQAGPCSSRRIVTFSRVRLVGPVARRAGVLTAVLAAVLLHAASAGATACTSSIAGPNDPQFAPAERAPLSGQTFNVEEWPLYDCIPQSAPLAGDPQGMAGMAVNRAWATFGYGNPGVTVAYMEGGINWAL